MGTGSSGSSNSGGLLEIASMASADSTIMYLYAYVHDSTHTLHVLVKKVTYIVHVHNDNYFAQHLQATQVGPLTYLYQSMLAHDYLLDIAST